MRDILSDTGKHLNIFKHWKGFHVEGILRRAPGDRREV